MSKLKKCSICKKCKDATYFHKDSWASDGLNNKCKECMSAIRKKYYQKHKSKILKKSRSKKFKAARMRKYHNKRANEDPDYWLKRLLSTRYRMTYDQYVSLFNRQGRRCPICWTNAPYSWHIDHNHLCCPKNGKSCGKCVRGILCNTCNVILGKFKDDIAIFYRAIQYLENNSKNHQQS